jgi:hypothetical protein
VKASFFNYLPLKISTTILCLLIFISSAIFFLFDIGDQSIRYSDEATHVRVIQEMIATGDYLNPTLDGEPYLNKPPLKMWLTIAITNWFGESNFTFRTIDGLCSAAIVTLIFSLAFKMFNSWLIAFACAFVLISSQGFFITARQNTATQDAFVVFCNTAALYIGFLILDSIKARRNVILALFFGLFIAAGFLAKTVVGLVPIMVIVPVLLLNHKQSIKNSSRLVVIAIVSGLTAVIPIFLYYYTVFQRVPNAWSRVFGYDVQQRLFTEGFHNAEKWWYYFERLFIDADFTSSWILALALASSLACALFRRSLADVYIMSWALIPLIVFSLLQSRAFHYIAPAFPAFALAIGQLLSFNPSRFSRYLNFIICFALLFNFSQASKRFFRESKKLPIEIVSQNLKAIPDIKNFYQIDLSKYLDGDTYQRWRQQFYLDIISRNIQKIETIEQVQSGSVLFTNWDRGTELLLNDDFRSRVCGYWPLWKPKAKRQSLANDINQKPEAVAILVAKCPDQIFNFSSFRPLHREIDLLNSFGFGLNIGKKNEIERINSNSVAFELPKEDLISYLSYSLLLKAAVTAIGDTYHQLNLLINLNGLPIGAISIAGGRKREYSIELPKSLLSESANLITIHVPEGDGLSRLKLNSIAIKPQYDSALASKASLDSY